MSKSTRQFGPTRTVEIFPGKDVAENSIVVTFTKWGEMYSWHVVSFSDQIPGSGYQVVVNECGTLHVFDDLDPEDAVFVA